MTRWLQLVTFLGLVVGGVTAAGAATIFDNGSPNLATGFTSDFTSGGHESADTFVLVAGMSTITDVHWYGGYYDNVAGTDNFTMFIRSDAGEPFALVHLNHFGNSATRTATGSQMLGLDVYAYEMVVAPIPLDSGITYWLSIVNSTSNGWFWATSTLFGDARQLDPEFGTWDDLAVELAFSLTNDVAESVPEPMSLALFGAGLLVVLARRQRRRQAPGNGVR